MLAMASLTEQSSTWPRRRRFSRCQSAASVAKANVALGAVVGEARRRAERVLLRGAGLERDGAGRGEHAVGRQPARPRPGEPVRGDRRDDQMRVALGELVRVEPGAGLAGGDDGVAVREQLVQPLQTLGASSRSSATLFLPALRTAKNRLVPSCSGASPRALEPSGGSTLMTSAPRSASRRPHSSPRSTVRSTTRISGERSDHRLMVPWARRASCGGFGSRAAAADR